MRRTSVYVLIDTSGSMRGARLKTMEQGLLAMTKALKRFVQVPEVASVGVWAFDTEVRMLAPLTPLDELRIPPISAPRSGGTHLGLALMTLAESIMADAEALTRDPMEEGASCLFVMTDGAVSDLQTFRRQCAVLRGLGLQIVGCWAGPEARLKELGPLWDRLMASDELNGASFFSLFEEMRAAALEQARRAAAKMILPPPPPEIRILF